MEREEGIMVKKRIPTMSTMSTIDREVFTELYHNDIERLKDLLLKRFKTCELKVE